MSDIVFSVIPGKSGNIGHVRLQRPQKLNALTPAMCHSLRQQLIRWAEEVSIKAVIICGTGERAFCSGGDLRAIYESQQAQDHNRYHFFYDEYAINRIIFHYPKPYIALLHGISMGGGLGIALHGSHRIADTSLSLAMPETKIGFYPDIGAGYFLSRCRGQLGRYLGMTSASINAAEAHYAGLIDHIIPRRAFQEFTQELAATKVMHFDRVIEHYKQSVSYDTPLLAKRAYIDAAFQHNTVEDIITELLFNPSPWAQGIYNILQDCNSTSLGVTLRHLQASSHQDFDTCMERDTHLTKEFLERSDFYEGIRAVIIDKDNKPRWIETNLRGSQKQLVDSFFQEFDSIRKQQDNFSRYFQNSRKHQCDKD